MAAKASWYRNYATVTVSFPPQPFLFFFRIHYMDSPDYLVLLLSIFRLLLFSFSVLHFLVVGSVR